MDILKVVCLDHDGRLIGVEAEEAPLDGFATGHVDDELPAEDEIEGGTILVSHVAEELRRALENGGLDADHDIWVWPQPEEVRRFVQRHFIHRLVRDDTIDVHDVATRIKRHLVARLGAIVK